MKTHFKKEADKPSNTWGHQKPEEARKESYLETSEGVWSYWYLDFGLLAVRIERECFCVFSHQVCTAALETNIATLYSVGENDRNSHLLFALGGVLSLQNYPSSLPGIKYPLRGLTSAKCQAFTLWETS